MAVYTQVNAGQVAAFLRDYDLGDYVRHEGITQGVENTNYHLFTTAGRYILTIFEKRIDPQSLPFVFGFMNHLSGQALPVPEVIKNKSGHLTRPLSGKHAAITTFLPGKDPHRDAITPDQCRQFGSVLAQMHLAVAGFSDRRDNPVGIKTWRHLLDQVRQHDGAMMPEAIVAPILRDFGMVNHAELPGGAVHADLCQDNVFFDEHGTLSGVIDFYFSCTDAFVYDLAVGVNSWCFDTADTLVPARLQAMVAGYESVRPLNALEREVWETVRRAAALRMFSTRLYDWVFTPPDADVKKHDPNEYLAKMETVCPLP
jgi:homoserine kinase type II